MKDFAIHFSLGFIISALGWFLSGHAIWVIACPISWALSIIFWKICEKLEHERLGKILFRDIKNFGISLLSSKVSRSITDMEEDCKIILGKERINSTINQVITYKNKKILKLNNVWTYGGIIYAYSYEMNDSIFDHRKIEKRLYKLGFKKESEGYFTTNKIDILITRSRIIRVTDITISNIIQKEMNSINSKIKSDLYD